MSEQELEQPESMHDTLSEAFDDVEPEDQPAEPVEPVETPTEPLIEQEGVAADSDAGDGDPTPPPQDAESKAPQSWGVAEREGWANIPPEIQNQISKREAETQQVLMQSGQARKFQEEFDQAASPFLGFIQAEGATPMSAFTGLMQTAATLQAGAPQQKAQRVAEIIQHYGIDVEMLDSLLVGEQPQTGDDARLGQMLDQRLQPMMNTLNQFQQSQVDQRQQSEQQTNTQIGEFMAQNEFAKDVRFEMADLMEMAGRRNETLTLQGAYEKALLLRPEIQQVIQQRAAGAQAQQGNQQIQQKQNASVSVAGGAAMTGAAPKPGSMREAIEAAINP